MRGANSVSVIEVDKNRVIKPLKNIAIKKNIFKIFDEDLCFSAVMSAKIVIDNVSSLYFMLINGSVATNCLNKSFNISINFSPH